MQCWSKFPAITLMAASIVLALLANPRAALAQQNQPVTEDGLLRLLQARTQARIPVKDIIRTIEERGVTFQLTAAFEEEIAEATKGLTAKDARDLMSAIRDNFRPPAKQPFRITFYSLQGHAVDFFLDGKIDKNWDEVLAGKRFMVRNEVLSALRHLRRKFSSSRFGEETFFNETAEIKDAYFNDDLAALYQATRKGLFVGSAGEPFPEEGSPGIAVSITEPIELIPSLNDPSKQWRLIEVVADTVSETSKGVRKAPNDIYTFRKYAEKGDLQAFRGVRLSDFYSYITRNYFPPDFAIIELSVERVEDEQAVDACGGPQKVTNRGWLETNATLFGPLLRFNVAIVENISEDPLSIGRFFFKQNKSETLRTREEDRIVLDLQPFTKEALFSPGVLKPAEKLVIPLEMSLQLQNGKETRFWDSPSESASDPSQFATQLAKVRQSGGLRLPRLGNAPRIKPESIERMLARPKIDFGTMTEYLYGPSVRIENVEINSYGYLIRRYDPKKLLITGAGQEVGSCPYVYTYSADANSWFSEGVILYGRDSKSKESTDELLLKRFNGRILIRERDPEDSFIDEVEIRAIGSDGSESVLRPKIGKLLQADGDYVKLSQGEELLIDFELPPNLKAERYVLVASGYYIPYKEKLKRQAGPSARQWWKPRQHVSLRDSPFQQLR